MYRRSRFKNFLATELRTKNGSSNQGRLTMASKKIFPMIITQYYLILL